MGGRSQVREDGTNSVLWNSMVRRMQAEEAARESAVANLAAWVERAIRSLSARIDDVRALVDGPTMQSSVQSNSGGVSDAAASAEVRILELECMRELQAMRGVLVESHEQQELCVRELAEKYKELKSAHTASCVEQGQALQHLSETHLEIKAAHNAAAVEQQNALRRLSQEVADALTAGRDSRQEALPGVGEPVHSSADVGTPKGTTYRSCVIREEPESGKSRDSLGQRSSSREHLSSTRLATRLDAEDSKLVSHVTNEVRRLSDDVLLCKAASEEARRVITEECFKFGARLSQLELEFRSRTSQLALVPLSGAPLSGPFLRASSPSAGELRAASPSRQTWPLTQARGSSPAKSSEPVAVSASLMASRSYGRLPGTVAAPPPSARSPSLSHASSTPSLLSQVQLNSHVGWNAS